MASPFSNAHSDGALADSAGMERETQIFDLAGLQCDTDSTPLSVDLGHGYDVQQALGLIDRILPFEACLYHQILPLSLNEGQLRLGMVNLDDLVALEYARKILTFLQYRLVPQTIRCETHHQVLTHYLHQHASDRTPSTATPITPALVTSTPVTPAPNPQATLLLDNHEQVTVDPLIDQPDRPFSPAAPTLIQPQQMPTTPKVPQHLWPKTTLPELELSQAASPVTVGEQTAKLSAHDLLQVLLGRVLNSGIGRLYFERLPEAGRVLWSENGLPRSVFERISIEQFDGLIEAVKELMRVPPGVLDRPLQVEIERRYRQDRILLRLRLIPKQVGGLATLQVLRGAALKFHQQQQMTTLSRDTLTVAYELQKKLEELQDRAQTLTHSPDESLSVVPMLDTVIRDVERRLNILKGLGES